MSCDNTLKITNLPKELSDADKEEFCRHFGATKVKVITSKTKQKSVVFAKFESKEIATAVMYRLHQAYVLKSRLCVQYAAQEIGLPRLDRRETEEDHSRNNKDQFNNFIKELNALNTAVGFNQPPPSHLKYVYPKANRLTINNIGHALASVPKFYTQVLHLMNRMNLPPPFAVEPISQQRAVGRPANDARQHQPVAPSTQSQNKSESESELESDEDEKATLANTVAPQKRKIPHGKQTIKRPKFIKPPPAPNPNAPKHNTKPVDTIFESVENIGEKSKKIQMKVTGSLDQISIGTDSNIGAIGTIGLADEDAKTAKTAEESCVISDEELASNRIPAKDLDVVAVFKKYHPGVPSTRLYIKNIAKTVELKDLEYIYNRYRKSMKETYSEQKSDDPQQQQYQFDIRLMQEGRMKGQAFITLDSVEIAQKALNETNAYILKDKPLVVVFAKSVPTKVQHPV